MSDYTKGMVVDGPFSSYRVGNVNFFWDLDFVFVYLDDIKLRDRVVAQRTPSVSVKCLIQARLTIITKESCFFAIELDFRRVQTLYTFLNLMPPLKGAASLNRRFAPNLYYFIHEYACLLSKRSAISEK